MSHGQYSIDVDVDPAFLELVDPEDVRGAAAATLYAEAVDRGSMAIVLAEDEAVRRLNAQYRGIDAPTDVLSFPARGGDEDDPIAASLPPELAAELAASLGDLMIALPYTRQQAQRYGATLDAELRLLVVHGTLHLLGYDHATEDERRAMWAAQDRVLAQYGERTPDARVYD